jgi:hypothetical protein
LLAALARSIDGYQVGPELAVEGMEQEHPPVARWIWVPVRRTWRPVRRIWGLGLMRRKRPGGERAPLSVGWLVAMAMVMVVVIMVMD